MWDSSRKFQDPNFEMTTKRQEVMTIAIYRAYGLDTPEYISGFSDESSLAAARRTCVHSLFWTLRSFYQYWSPTAPQWFLKGLISDPKFQPSSASKPAGSNSRKRRDSRTGMVMECNCSKLVRLGWKDEGLSIIICSCYSLFLAIWVDIVVDWFCPCIVFVYTLVIYFVTSIIFCSSICSSLDAEQGKLLNDITLLTISGGYYWRLRCKRSCSNSTICAEWLCWKKAPRGYR